MRYEFERDPELPPEPDRVRHTHSAAGTVFAVLLIIGGLLFIAMLGAASSVGDIDFDCLGNC